MKQNMGILDRIVRAALAVLVAVLYFTGQLGPVASVILGIIAVVFLVTAAVGVCPPYLLVGLSTRRRTAQ